MMKTYTVGVDFGTLSARAVLLDAVEGVLVAEAMYQYPHGVMDTAMPNGKPLPPHYALQHPADYLEALRTVLPAVLQRGGIAPEQVAGLALDFTACTVLPIDEAGQPLCFSPAFCDEPHAYVKLWKHHGAMREAEEIQALAEERGEPWLSIYGGKISCEWLLPKLLEIVHEAPQVFAATARFTEAGDWLSYCLTGQETHSAAFAGYKALWNAETGYPSPAFMAALDPRLGDVVGSRLAAHISPVQETAGRLHAEGAALTGLPIGTPLALPMIDAHAAMPALNLVREGDMLLVVGTSSCHILNARRGLCVPGICGYVKDGVVPGFYTYEAGQAAVGDIFDWFVQNCLPAAYLQEATERRISPHALLREKAMRLHPGESGLVALDWWNGNRSVLVDAALSGLLVGLTLRTRPEEIYRALLEATAFGTRKIIEQYAACGLPVSSICAAGGIAQKDPLMMQIYADVLQKEIHISGAPQAGALGSAITAAVAGGLYATVAEAAEQLAPPYAHTYAPTPEGVTAYNRLYAIYEALHDHFGKDMPSLMHSLHQP